MFVAASAALAAPEIRFKVVNGKPCAKCTLAVGERSIPANVVIDLGTHAPLLLHERTAKLLRVAPDSTADLRFDGAVLGGLRPRAAKLRSLEELTNKYAPDLDEMPAVAIVGLPAFAEFTVELEIGAGVLRCLPASEHPPAATQPAEAGPATRNAEDEPRSWSGPYEDRGYGYWLTGQAPGGFALRIMLSTAYYDTIIDANAADLAGSAGGAIDSLHMGDLNIARYVAFRPEDLSGMPKPQPDVILGTNLLSHFRMTIEPQSRRIAFRQTRSPSFPAEERQFFVARAQSDANAIEAFLKAHASSRLAADASEKLLALRMDEDPPNHDAILRAVRWQAESAPKDRRAATMLALADELLGKPRDGQARLVAEVVKVGLEYAPSALNSRTTHDLRARLGLLALQRGDLAEARRQLLSAAFAIPRDPLVNLWLGQLYEKSGQLTRAWSRYVQAAISDNPPPDAMRGLDRLNRDRAFRDAFTMADAEQLLEGRVVEFHPPDRWTGGDHHVRLVELFTCADEPATQGPQLAFDGLREHFDTADVAFIQYHLAAPAADPMVTECGRRRAAFYGIQETPAVFFDGGRPITDGGSERDVEKLYQAYKEACAAPETPAMRWRIEGTASFASGRITGEIRVGGPPAADLRLHAVLCEQTVMVPGANGIVLHRCVARADLLPEAGAPLPAAPGAEPFRIAVNLAELGAALERTIAAVEKEKEAQFLVRPTLVDGRACMIVAFLQDSRTRQVHAARAIAVSAAKATATGKAP